jgi:signal transduction histidine kinase
MADFTPASRMLVPVANDVPRARFPATVEATAYFVIVEALTNIAKHADARRVAVIARIEGDTLHVEIHDDGVGAAWPGGRGRLAVEDRLAAVGGRLEIARSAPGTRVVAAIPLRAGE